MADNTLTYIKSEKQLSKLTGLNHEQLWKAGFNLDDWDFCIATKLDLEKSFPWLAHRLENYCCGCEKVTYEGNNYYMAYHS